MNGLWAGGGAPLIGLSAAFNSLHGTARIIGASILLVLSVVFVIAVAISIWRGPGF